MPADPAVCEVRSDQALYHRAGLHGDAAVIQRKPPLAPVQQRDDDRIDADGYAIPRRRNSPPHIACIKGVLGDAVRSKPEPRGPASRFMQAWREGMRAAPIS